MRIAILSDLQSDSYDRLSRSNNAGSTSRLEDIVTAIGWAVDEAVAAGCTLLVVLGDVFDSRTSISLPVLDRTCRALHDASQRFERTVFVVGNHDSYLRSPVINSLQVFRGFGDVVDDGPLVVGDAMFVPWSDELATITAWIDSVAKPPPYLFSHLLVKGAVPDKTKGADHSVLRPERFKRVILGDVHAPAKHGKNLYYAGALLPLHFGDARSPRGFHILDTATDAWEHRPNKVSPRFHILRPGITGEPVEPHDYVRVEADDPVKAELLANNARATGAWVENTAPRPKVEVVPRTDLRSRMNDDELLEGYMRHQGVDDPTLLALGQRLLLEARTP